jgi:hypothetical protein
MNLRVSTGSHVQATQLRDNQCASTVSYFLAVAVMNTYNPSPTHYHILLLPWQSAFAFQIVNSQVLLHQVKLMLSVKHMSTDRCRFIRVIMPTLPDTCESGCTALSCKSLSIIPWKNNANFFLSTSKAVVLRNRPTSNPNNKLLERAAIPSDS